jgi:hypothetical protein
VAHHRLQVSVSESLYGRIQEAAGRSTVPVAVWVREAVEERLDREFRGSSEEALEAMCKLDAPTADIDDMLAEIAAGRA